jgi:phosphohistidine phosphatase
MNIILFRHGDAEDHTPGVSGDERKLTPKGEAITRQNANLIKQFIGTPDYIVSSPLLRARQTAEIIAAEMNYTSEIIIDEKLNSGSESDDVIDIANYLDAANIMFVGHQPDLSKHVSYMISSTGAAVEFRKSAAAKVSFNKKAAPGRGVLEFLIPPLQEK